MSVKRYDMEDKCGGEYNCGMIENKDGEYVEYEDYKKLDCFHFLLEEALNRLKIMYEVLFEDYKKLIEENKLLKL